MNIFPGKFSGGYGIFSDGDPGLYDGSGMVCSSGADSVNINVFNGNPNGLNPASSSGPMMMMANLKRALWPVAEEEQDASPSKRFHGVGGGDCLNMPSSVMEETPPLMQQGGVLGDDGLFRTTSYQLPGLNCLSVALVSNLQDERPSTSDSVDITAKEEVEEIDVTNGDGIDSIGLVSLVEALVNKGLYNVHVYAPQTFGEYEQRHRRPPLHRHRTPRFYSEREFASD
ncbi:hypothetical protein Bca52824_041339 [Brassica carinata]|uniref:Uncharacterized protein n=1 Tax=Brassica carinata TaxID=52824 RepID=A0A8X7RX75_BRACI|nr:hypothetical protein Bca52824_041339 [Brassica carinata]